MSCGEVKLEWSNCKVFSWGFNQWLQPSETKNKQIIVQHGFCRRFFDTQVAWFTDAGGMLDVAAK